MRNSYLFGNVMADLPEPAEVPAELGYFLLSLCSLFYF